MASFHVQERRIYESYVRDLLRNDVAVAAPAFASADNKVVDPAWKLRFDNLCARGSWVALLAKPTLGRWNECFACARADSDGGLDELRKKQTVY